jgi:hypothetical protein
MGKFASMLCNPTETPQRDLGRILSQSENQGFRASLTQVLSNIDNCPYVLRITISAVCWIATQIVALPHFEQRVRACLSHLRETLVFLVQERLDVACNT